QATFRRNKLHFSNSISPNTPSYLLRITPPDQTSNVIGANGWNESFSQYR
ncbi:hypothetical protein BB560_005757, partial [Smittium megazygosporum]